MDVAEFYSLPQAGEIASSRLVGLFLRQGQELGYALSARLALLDLRDGRGQLLCRGNHQYKHHDVGDKQVWCNPLVAPYHQRRAKKKDAYHHAIAREVTHRRGEVHAAEHPCAQACMTLRSLLEPSVRKTDGCVSLNHLQPHNSLLHQRHKEGIALLQHGGFAPQAVGNAGYNQRNHGQHEEDKNGEPDADIEKHGEVKDQTDNGRKQPLQGAKGALVILRNIARKTRQHVTPAVSAEIGKRKCKHFVEHTAAEVPHNASTDNGNLHQREVAENILTGIKPQQQ